MLSSMKIQALKSVATSAAVELSVLEHLNAQIDNLNAKVRDLRTDDAALMKEHIALQGTKSPPADPATQAALELLDGSRREITKSKSERIREINEKRAAIAKAMEIANGRMTRLLLDRAIEKRRLMADDWAELQRERVLAIVYLQSLNRRAQALLGTVVDPYGHADMPASFPGNSVATFLLGNGSHRAGEAYEFIELNIKNGTVTRGEVDKAKEEV